MRSRREMQWQRLTGPESVRLPHAGGSGGRAAPAGFWLKAAAKVHYQPHNFADIPSK